MNKKQREVKRKKAGRRYTTFGVLTIQGKYQTF